MSDKTFERSMISISIIAILWMILGSIFVMSNSWGWAIVIGLIVWIIGGGTLLHFWGKAYMNKL